ncbi:methyltransferase [Pseudomonas sp. RL_15y_Pfl2_60]|uniref:methyltransferase n=1 Tax=Pseudomonas sp. RL_15y_Pfl2_60 TaxID=3088709 RepID=UPI0030DB8E98
MPAKDLTEHFEALNRFLSEHQALWRPRPFSDRPMAWEQTHGQLATWLKSRSLAQAEQAQAEPHKLNAPEPFASLAEQAQALCQIAPLPLINSPQLPNRLSNDIPGRKWLQIQAFASSLSFEQPTKHWLDWCSGKGHLGRLLARQGQPLSCLEHDPELVDKGAKLSQKLGINAQHIEQDVLAPSAIKQLKTEHTAVALHACGDLHVRLIQLASEVGCQQLAIAPCCYNRISTQHYKPLSQPAKAAGLELSIQDLGLPLSETVTAGARVQKQRDISMARRLAFDSLQREIRGLDEYLPTPSLASSWLNKPFAEFCIDLAALKQIPPPPASTDWLKLEAKGWELLAQVRNLELLRGLFRRPLEVWLLLDRALYLCEQGYAVQLGTFCSRELTPRNLMLVAERIGSARQGCG